MACKIQIEKSLRDKVDLQLSSIPYGTRESVRHNLKPLQKEYGFMVGVPWSYTPGVYKASISETNFQRAVEKEYTRQYILQNEIENEFERLLAKGEIEEPTTKSQRLKTSSQIDTGLSGIALAEQLLNEERKDRRYTKAEVEKLKKEDGSFQEEKNHKELTKGKESIDNMKGILNTEKGFDNFFPEYTYLTKEEKEYLVNSYLDGTTEISCKI